MRFSVVSLILSAGLAVSAAPIRVVVVSENFSSSSGFVRVGHAAANPHHNHHNHNADANVATMHTVTNVRMKPKHGCAGSFRAKAMQVSEWFKHVLGMPATTNAMAKPLPPAPEGMAHILPVGGSINVSVKGAEVRPGGRLVPHHHHHLPHAQHIARPHTFVQRLTRALMMLGPWEGRAVSFILGCGIGVLIRMFWVLTVVALRSIRGKKQEEEFLGDEVIFEEEEHLLPPQYVEAYVAKEKGEPVEVVSST